jgi:hypothetical protein
MCSLGENWFSYVRYVGLLTCGAAALDLGRWEPQIAQPGYQHPQLQGQYGPPQNAGYHPGYVQPPK